MIAKNLKRVFTNKTGPRISLMIISTFLIMVILASLHLRYIWNKYQTMAELEALQLAVSIESLLHTEHIAALASEDGIEANSVEGLVVQSLIRLVEASDSIHYAYILKQENDDYIVLADSTTNSLPASHIRRRCEETTEINHLPFETGQSIISNPSPSSCGNWIRVLVPIYDEEQEDILAVLGLSYSADEWKSALWQKMIPDVIIVSFVVMLILTIFAIYRKHMNLVESERSKSVILSHLPGMSYRCANDLAWTMEFVSEGCYSLTGYKAEDFIGNRVISYSELISPEYRDLVFAEWKRVLMQGKNYRDEYEIITKSKQRKWVLEIGQGIYDSTGEIEALEGIILDITEKKMQEYQIADLKDHDLLTGLYNRSFMEQEIIRLDHPEFLPLSIAICDIDGLRMVNDAYGHVEGDKLIVKASRLIQNSLSGDYVLGHSGGGEFVIYLPRRDKKAMYQLKEEMKVIFENYNKCNNSGPTISISVGNSTKETEDQDIQDVIKVTEKHLNRRKLLNQNSSYSTIVSSIMATLYAKSQETEEHGQRLGKLCSRIGKELKLSQVELDDLLLLSKLHDIGKIGIDDYILNKPDKLSEVEWKVMRQHPEIGYRIAMATPQLKHIAEYILYHHERWDGTGYPIGLYEEKIPLVSRILAIADAYDAMTEDRIYRRALSKKTALKEIGKNAGKQFDPKIAELFVRILGEEGDSLLNRNDS
ncbi:MAG: diguanylate cyclase [Clostridiales bacterium]|nr:diguanylate cyclase [Clostridiales bacterium]